MHDIKKDTNSPLALFVNDYVEGRLDPTEQSALEECMADDSDLFLFTQKSVLGKKAFKNAFDVKAADDFEEKLAQRIAKEKHESNLELIS